MEMVEKMGKLYPVRRIGQTPETSAAILFAASPGASFITLDQVSWLTVESLLVLLEKL